MTSNFLPSLNALRAFESTARLGSVTLAASELCVTPSAISHQIRKLEENLGYSLIKFQNGKPQLSEWGYTILPYLNDAFMKIHQAMETLNQKNNEISLTVATRSLFSHNWLMPKLTNFWNTYPNITLKMRYRLEHNNLTKGVDISIEWHKPENQPKNSIKLENGFLTPVYSPKLLKDNQKISDPKEIFQHTIFRESLDDCWLEWAKLAQITTDISMDKSIVMDDGIIRLKAILEGQGVDLCIESFLEQELEQKTLIAPFKDIKIEGYYYLVHHREEITTEAKIFENWAIEQSKQKHN